MDFQRRRECLDRMLTQVVRACEAPVPSDRITRRLHREIARLNETALVIEAQAAEFRLVPFERLVEVPGQHGQHRPVSPRQLRRLDLALNRPAAHHCQEGVTVWAARALGGRGLRGDRQLGAGERDDLHAQRRQLPGDLRVDGRAVGPEGVVRRVDHHAERGWPAAQ
jgi:hypothetical protein